MLLESSADRIESSSIGPTRSFDQGRCSCHRSTSPSTASGTRRTVEPRTLLADFIREGLGLTGTKVGCETSQCGACTVTLDGHAVKSCTVLAVQADGGSVTTIEGLAGDGGLHPLQEAFWEQHGLQCGFCTPGMIMSATRADRGRRASTTTQIRHGLEGNLCRCTGYENIVQRRRGTAARGGERRWRRQLHERLDRRADQARRGSAADHRRRAATSTTSSSRASRTSRSCARRTRTPASASIDTSRAAASPGVVARLHRAGLRAPEPAAVRVAGDGNREPRGHAARARDRQGDLHRRGRRRGRRRDARGGRGRARADRGRLGAARRRRRRRAGDGSRARRRSTSRRRGNVVMDWECGDAAADRRRRSRRPTSSSGSGSSTSG